MAQNHLSFISGVLLTRDNDGKLEPFRELEFTITSKLESTNSSSPSADPTPSTITDSLDQLKNEKGGSHVALLQ